MDYQGNSHGPAVMPTVCLSKRNDIHVFGKICQFSKLEIHREISLSHNLAFSFSCVA